MVRHGVEQGPALTRRIAHVLLVVAVVGVFYGFMVAARADQYGVVWFVHIGDRFLHSAHTSAAIDRVGRPQSTFGYDGQFYFFIAADPARGMDYMRYGPDGDQSGKRYARILYPLAARAAAAGRPGAVPYAMLVLNLLAIGAGTFAVGWWLARHGRSPWFAVLYGLWPGMIFAVFRDLSEPLAYCLATLAVLACSRRVWLACALLALALLCRETVIAFPLAGAVALWLQDRRLRRPLLFAAGAILPMVAWRLFVTEWLHATTLDHTGGWKVLLPFYGMYSWWPWEEQHLLVFWCCDVPLLLAALGGLSLLRRRRAIPNATLLLLNVALFVVWIPHAVTIDYGAAGRNAAPALLGALYCIPAWRDRRTLVPLALLLSPIWFFVVAKLVGAPGLALVTG